MQNDTIAALSTPVAPAGLGVIRVSGSDAVSIAAKVFCPQGNKQLTQMAGYTAAFGHVADKDGVIDECVALVFRAPHSYTGEDVVELSCHGGVYLLRRVLRALYDAGARPAQAGEFTRRAFLNGKMDLTAAEAVMDLIAADGQLAARTALSARSGNTFRQLSDINAQLLGLAALFTAFIDYPDDDIPPLPTDEMLKTLQSVQTQLTQLLSTFDAGRVLREGVDTAIVGSPNVGKSTLMNALAGCERSIVTPIAGTTRDIVEETVRLGDVTLRLSDTAGVRETSDAVESIGVRKSLERLRDAALILAVFDGGAPLSSDDRDLIEQLKGTAAVAIINKADTAQKIEREELATACPYLVDISAKTGDGLEALTAAVADITGVCRLQGDTPVLATERQRAEVARALQAVEEGISALQYGMTQDAVSVCVDSAINSLLSLTGERATEAVVAEVFSRFCVGK